MITQWFDPEPALKGMVFARELVRRGFEVEVLTGFPNYPGGKVYPGYRIRPLQRERIDGVEVTRVALYPSHDQSGVRRALNYLSFAFSAACYVLLRARRPDVIYAYHPPLTVGIVGVLARWIRRVPLVLDIQDLWPDTLRATGMISSERLFGLVGRVCRWVYRRVDTIVVLSPGFKRTLIARGVPESRIELIYNWCDEAALAVTGGRLPETFPGPDRFRIVFAGNLGKAQALDAVLDAAAMLRERAAEVMLVFVGGGIERDRLRKKAVDSSLTNVVFLDQMPMSEVGAVLGAADVLLVHLRDDELFKITIPSKTQAYMAVGRPVLMAVSGDAADLVRASQCGVVARSEDPASICDAILSLARAERTALSAMSDAGRDYYRANLSLAVGARGFAAIFERLIAARGRA